MSLRALEARLKGVPRYEPFFQTPASPFAAAGAKT